MSKLGDFLNKCEVSESKDKDTLQRLIKMEKAGKLRVVKGLCSGCDWYQSWWTEVDGEKWGKCMLSMTANKPNEYCSKWKKRNREIGD